MNSPRQSTTTYEWYTFGDINAFFGLLLDNLAGLILTVSLLVYQFEMPSDFVIGSMVPGTAIGVLVGDLLYSWLAFRLSKRSGSSTITAMPLGLDTPSIFGITTLVVGPAFLAAKGAGHSIEQASVIAWGIGICSMIYSGIFKVGCSFIGGGIRRVLPKAGLFGSLTAIALVIISFVPLIDIFHEPIPGLVALAIILISLIGRVPLPFKMPGTVAALIVAGIVHYISAYLLGSPMTAPMETVQILPMGWLDVFQFAWQQQLVPAIGYLPVVIPFALATVVGGLDCSESASAAGDHYPTWQILGTEAVATLIAGLCGGIIQTTPYIGHPAYKAMGGRAAYTIATALVMGIVGVIGGFGLFYTFVPKSIVFPILIFVGLEIASQSFLATPKRHYPALVLACVPALAFLALLFAEQVTMNLGAPIIETVLSSEPQAAEVASKLRPDLRENLIVLMLLKNGFVLSSVLWASLLASALDRKMYTAAVYSILCAVCTLFGLVHSPLPSNAIFTLVPIPGVSDAWILPQHLQSYTWQLVLGYVGVTCLLILWGTYLKSIGEKVCSD